jgi:hypothetical protein
MFKTRTAKTETPSTAARLAELNASLAKIRQDRAKDVEEARRLGPPAMIGQSPQAARIRQAADKLLNGSFADFLPVDQSDRREALKFQIAAADEALERGGQIVEQLQNEAAAERVKANAPAFRAAMGDIAKALIALEHAFQARDTLVKEIKPGRLMEGDGWVLAGRLANSGSQSYRFLQTAAECGWIKPEEFATEVRRARGPKQ